MQSPILKCRLFEKQCQDLLKRCYTEETKYTLKKSKIIHPYRKLHPWESRKKFSEHLLNNVIYNKDGLVAINKPYGISAGGDQASIKNKNKIYTKTANEVDYTLANNIDFVAKELGYSQLTIAKSPEKFTSGVALLAANDRVRNAIEYSCNKANTMNTFFKTYWFVTTRVPATINGRQNWFMVRRPDGAGKFSRAKIVLEKDSSINAVKRREAKPLKVDFNIISNSTNNLSSLIEIQSSTTKWHALRLFASTRLYAPILGDNLYSTRIHELGGTWVLTDPYIEVDGLPKINSELLEMLHLTKDKQELIPCHIHMRRFLLINFLKKEDVVIEAPLIPPLDWTCKQLKFKHIPEFEETNELVTVSGA